MDIGISVRNIYLFKKDSHERLPTALHDVTFHQFIALVLVLRVVWSNQNKVVHWKGEDENTDMEAKCKQKPADR